MSDEKKPPSKSDLDNRANQLNPNHPAFHRSRGHSEEEAAKLAQHSKPALDNRSNQLNPNHPATKNPQNRQNP